MEFHTIRTTHYYCPYCERSQWLFSLKPISTDEWVCTKCHRPFLLDTRAVMHSWLNTIALWSMAPIGLFLIIFFSIVTRADKVIWALLVGVPLFTFLLALLIYVACIPISWAVAARIKRKAGPGQRGLKTVRREVS